MALADVAPVSGRSGADIAASLAGLAMPVMATVPSVLAELAAATVPSQEQPDIAMVVSEGVAQSAPPVA